MAKGRLGKKDSIFNATTTQEAPAVTVASGTNGSGSAGTSIENKITVILPPEQIMYLDRFCLDIRMKTGAKMKRTQVVRALVAALQEADLDLTDAESEEDLAVRLQAAFS